MSYVDNSLNMLGLVDVFTGVVDIDPLTQEPRAIFQRAESPSSGEVVSPDSNKFYKTAPTIRAELARLQDKNTIMDSGYRQLSIAEDQSALTALEKYTLQGQS